MLQLAVIELKIRGQVEVDLGKTHEELAQMFQDDPDEFDRYCAAQIDKIIDALPEERRERARCQQWRITQDLRHYKDPIARMNKMVELFWLGVKDFQNVLNNPTEFVAKTQDVSKAEVFKIDTDKE